MIPDIAVRVCDPPLNGISFGGFGMVRPTALCDGIAHRCFPRARTIVIVTALAIGLGGLPFVTVGAIDFFRNQQIAKQETAKLGIQKIEDGMWKFKLDRGDFPRSLGDLTSVKAGAFLDDKDLIDPWGNRYEWDSTARNTSQKPRIFTVTPDRQVIANREP
jgi:hypothetical protein